MITDDPTCPVCTMPVRMHTATFAKVCLHEMCYVHETKKLKAGIAKYIDTIEKGGCDTEPVESIVEELELLLKEESA